MVTVGLTGSRCAISPSDSNTFYESTSTEPHRSRRVAGRYSLGEPLVVILVILCAQNFFLLRALCVLGRITPELTVD